MQRGLDFFEGIRKLLTRHNILSISGESGTGKTTLALQLVGNLLTFNQPYQDSCVWIQASELFPLNRLTQIFSPREEILRYIQDNIFVIPKKKTIITYVKQSEIIQNIINPNADLPPSLKLIVIDNISYHLRYRLTQYNNPNDIIALLDSFYDTQIMPLILFCRQHRIILILIHEVTYSPKDDCNRAFFYKLYYRIKTIDLVLSNNYNNNKKTIRVSYNISKWDFDYTLGYNGIIIR
jgi:GTPase SAR1 family protein